MIIGINTFPLKSGHKIRGIGSYTKNLIDALKKRSDLEIVEFEDESDLKNVDLVHYTWFDLFFRTLHVNKIPTIVTIHDVMPLIFKNQYPIGIKGRINLELQKLALKKCKRIITVSQTSKKDVVKYLGIDQDKIEVTIESIDQNFRVLPKSESLEIKKKNNLPDKFLLYVGDVNYVKNLPFLIEAFIEMKRDPKFNDLKLVLVGGAFAKDITNLNHPELESLKEVNKLINDSIMSDDFIRPGFVELTDLVGIYNLATLYIQPSLYEGFGRQILEAFACGTPVLSSNAASLPEVGGEAALYFDPASKDDLIAKILLIYQDSALQDKYSKLGLERIKDFSLEKAAAETIEVYKQVLNSK